MRTRYLVATVLVLGSVLLAQTVPSPAPSAGSIATSEEGRFGASAVWEPGPDFLKSAHTACDNAKQPPSFAECFIDQMSKAGASPDAVSFTRELYQTNQQVGILRVLHSYGPVAMTWVEFPLRANDNYGILFVNGKPDFLDADDMQKLDKAPMLKDLMFQSYKKTNPNLDVWPADRSASGVYVQFARTYGGDKPGDIRFLFTYPLIDGCHACARNGFANFWWDFDAKGDFVGTKFISVSPVPPPIKRARPRPPSGSTPSAPGAPQLPSTTPQPPGASVPPQTDQPAAPPQPTPPPQPH